MTENDTLIDDDVFAETLTDLRDYLCACDLLSAVYDGPEQAREGIAAVLTVIRQTAVSISGLALLLRRIPDSREGVVEQLEELADTLRGLVLHEHEEMND